MPLEQTLEPSTALDAVNDMLRSIGQGKINSLVSSESVDAENAKVALTNSSREVQERGWYFNTDYGYPFTPNADGEVELPPNMLQFEPDRLWTHVVERGRKLYDRENRTFTFAAGTRITGRVTWLLPYDELPQAARTYIYRRAGRIFQVGAVGSDLLHQFTSEMEVEALASLNRAHLRAERPNAITDNPHTYRIAAGGRLRR